MLKQSLIRGLNSLVPWTPCIDNNTPNEKWMSGPHLHCATPITGQLSLPLGVVILTGLALLTKQASMQLC